MSSKNEYRQFTIKVEQQLDKSWTWLAYTTVSKPVSVTLNHNERIGFRDEAQALLNCKAVIDQWIK